MTGAQCHGIHELNGLFKGIAHRLRGMISVCLSAKNTKGDGVLENVGPAMIYQNIVLVLGVIKLAFSLKDTQNDGFQISHT